jgi:hypothetical protein
MSEGGDTIRQGRIFWISLSTVGSSAASHTSPRVMARPLLPRFWLIPEARRGGRPRKTDMRAATNAIFYLLRTGCP